MTQVTKRRPFRVALTGGIASGKSTVAALFERLGVPVLDTDLIARDVVEPGTPALAAIRERFGRSVLGNDGQLNRRALREIVFADASARRALEMLTHPAIVAELVRRSQAVGGAYQIWVIPLMIENERRIAVDRILLVDCSEDLQLRRVMARDGGTLAQAQAIVAAQTSRSARLAAAEDVIVNDGDSRHLDDAVAALHRRYLDLATASP